jgi:ABC-2 type transport system ATP-binding protein
MIELKNLQKVIEQNTVVDIPELTIESGGIIALVGPTRSGKGTLLSILIGQTRPTLGSARLDGIDPAAEKSIFSKKVGVLFFDDSLYESRSPKSNLIFHCRLRGLPKSRAVEILSKVGLADHANAKLDKLSSGLARRLAFGRTILHEPIILLLVDPFARCDEASIALLSKLIREQADGGAAVLILAEDITHLTGLSDSIHMLNNGRIVETITPDEQAESQFPFKIPVRLEGRVALINPSDILYADAEEGRAYLHTLEGKLPTQFNLSELEQRLARSGFFRAHRGYLVNLQHVTEVIPFTRNSFSLRLDDDEGTLIPLSKTAAGELRDLLDY